MFSDTVFAMIQRLLRTMKAMEIEERIFHIGSFICLLGVFLPWMTTGSYGEEHLTVNGFGFRTGYIGHSIVLLGVFLAFMTLSPVLSGPIIVRKSLRHILRLLISGSILLLLLSAFSVLLRVTSEVSGIEIRFGVYVAMIGSALSFLYSFLAYQEVENNKVRDLFHHPDEPKVARPSLDTIDQEFVPPPPPPPPAAPPPEDHHLFSKSL